MESPGLSTQDTGNEREDVAKYYDAVASEYYRKYQRENLLGEKYPQNYYRLQLLVQRLAASHAHSIYEVGTGEGTPIAIMARMGFAVAGCDISENMVKLTQAHLQSINADSKRVQWGDIEDSLTTANQLAYGPFDALIAVGVMPHVAKDALALRNMRMFLKEGGKIFVEFRNKLFSLFTFNRYTKDFILNDLLADVADDVRAQVAVELDKRLALDQPPPETRGDGTPRYDTIHAKFHNPFEVTELMEREGFTHPRLHWYHYHPAPPMLENTMQKRFREEAQRLEHSSSWRGYFLCSAFVVEAQAN
ncbi:MAG: methyltransferase domain-containing protein [Chloroflexi bacterium]|nr:methyltransferase domain-containing protein [Chloroflexota bacterium]